MYLRKNIINIIFCVLKFKYPNIIKNVIEDIYNNKSNSTFCIEKDIKRLCNCANYLYDNLNKSLDSELISQSFYLLNNCLLSDEVKSKIIEIYYKNIDLAPHSLAALLHLHIRNNIEKNDLEFAFLISNYIMLKKDRWFLIPFEYCHSDYREAIENNDISSLIRIFYDIELVKKDKKACLLSRDEVIQKIKSIKEALVNIYCVDKLYLFGSFAKGNNTEKSDLDFALIFKESLINKEKNDMIKNMKYYLSNEFDCDVDLLDFSYALDTFDKSQMEYLITLI